MDAATTATATAMATEGSSQTPYEIFRNVATHTPLCNDGVPLFPDEGAEGFHSEEDTGCEEGESFGDDASDGEDDERSAASDGTATDGSARALLSPHSVDIRQKAQELLRQSSPSTRKERRSSRRTRSAAPLADPQTPPRENAGGTRQREASDAEGDLEVANNGANNSEPRKLADGSEESTPNEDSTWEDPPTDETEETDLEELLRTDDPATLRAAARATARRLSAQRSRGADLLGRLAELQGGIQVRALETGPRSQPSGTGAPRFFAFTRVFFLAAT